MSDEKLADLLAALRLAFRDRETAERERDHERRELVAEAATKIDGELEAKYGERIRALRDAEGRVRQALYVAKIEAGKAALSGFPSGVMVEWGYDMRHRWDRSREKKPTGRRGRYELRTADTEFPANTGSYRLPNIGQVFIRILKKDGSPGLKFESLRAGSDWRLEEGSEP